MWTRTKTGVPNPIKNNTQVPIQDLTTNDSHILVLVDASFCAYGCNDSPTKENHIKKIKKGWTKFVERMSAKAMAKEFYLMTKKEECEKRNEKKKGKMIVASNV